MSDISRFEVESWDSEDVARLRRRNGMKPCRVAKEKPFRGRAMKGPDGNCCPGCRDACALPAQVKAGNEFVIVSFEQEMEDAARQRMANGSIALVMG